MIYNKISNNVKFSCVLSFILNNIDILDNYIKALDIEKNIVYLYFKNNLKAEHKYIRGFYLAFLYMLL
jgi:hypothetical protein